MEIKDCGFNLAQRKTDIEDTKEILDVLPDTGVKLMARTFGMDKPDECQNDVNKLKDNPYIGAWQLGDEPKNCELTTLAQCMRKIYEIDKKHMSFINLNTSPQECDENTDNIARDEINYEAYLDEIQNKLRPAVWSYDYYPFMLKQPYESNIIVENRKYYMYLEYFSKQARKTKRPFWCYVLCQQFEIENTDEDGETYTRRSAKPTEALMKFETFCALAYGAQGLVFWNYQQSENNDTETYFDAPLDLNGEKTSIWYAVQNVLREVRKYTRVFLNSELVDCRHAGFVPIGCNALSLPFGPLTTLKTGSAGVLVSHLKKGVRNFMVIVNHDAFKGQQITIKFNTADNVRPFNIENRLSLDPDLGELTLFLEPSAVLIYEW